MSYKKLRYVWNKETKSFNEYDLSRPSKEPRESVAPWIRPDSMAPAVDAHGRVTDSWSQWNRSAKDKGFEVKHVDENVEDPSKRQKQMTDRDYEECAAKTIEQLRYSTYDQHFTEYDRAMCDRINERLKNRV